MAKLAIIHFLDGSDDSVDPGYGVGMPGFNRPDNSLPGSGLPPGGVNLPVYPFDPTLIPDNSLPTPPPSGHIDAGLPVPGKRYVVKYLACKGLILVPDNSLPPTAEPK